MELLSYPGLDPAAERTVREFLDSIAVVPLDARIRALAIELRRRHRLKLPDAIVAATARALDATLLSNDTDFQSIPDISVQRVRLHGK